MLLIELILVGISFIILSKLLDYYLKYQGKGLIYYQNTDKNDYIVKKLTPHLHRYHDIPVWGLSGSLQSIYASQIRKGPPLQRKRVDIENKHGYFSIHYILSDLPPTAPVVCLIPGIVGHVDNDYVKNFATYLYKHGFRVVVYNWPGCGDSPTYKNLSILGESSNIKRMINRVKQDYPDNFLCSIGISLGSNLLLKYLGQAGNTTPIKCAVALGCGFDGEVGIKYLNKSKLFMKTLAKKTIDLFKKNIEHYRDHPHIKQEKVLKINSLIEFDEEVTLKLKPKFKNTFEYYQQKSCRYFLDKVTIPTLIINSKDDPIVSDVLHEFGKDATTTNPNVIFAVTKYGGHIGWIRGDLFNVKNTTWGEKMSVRYLKQFLSSDFLM